MTRTVDLTPNYDNLIRNFGREALLRAEGLAARITGTDEQKLESLRFIQGLLASINICVEATHTAASVLEVRKLIGTVTDAVIKQADAIDNRIDAATCEKCGRVECDGESCMKGLL